MFSALWLLCRRASLSREATAMGQRSLYQSDLIFQSIKSIISTRANTTITLHSACNWAMYRVLLRQNWESSSQGKWYFTRTLKMFTSLPYEHARCIWKRAICKFLRFSRYLKLTTRIAICLYALSILEPINGTAQGPYTIVLGNNQVNTKIGKLAKIRRRLKTKTS